VWRRVFSIADRDDRQMALRRPTDRSMLAYVLPKLPRGSRAGRGLAAGGDRVKEGGSNVIDLAPDIHRQRAVIEGHPSRPLAADEIKEYLVGLSGVLRMKVLADPVTHRSEMFGEAAWIHWETSGAHFYSWEQPRLFFSVDIYTCKAFTVDDAVAYTKLFFDVATVEYSNVSSSDLEVGAPLL
jgi:hypothetical protein